MSREIGGRADKDGNEFERLWVVDQALRLLQGMATSLQWEPPGKAGFGMELEVLLPDGRREVHQCKIEKDLQGQWSAADLNRAGALKAALRHLERPGVAEFVFVSRDPAAPALRDLVERTHRTNDDPELFFATALSADGHRKEFEQLCKVWDLDIGQVSDRARAYSILQRLRFENGIWDRSHRDRLEFNASLLAEGEGREIVNSLGASLSNNLGKDVYADDIRKYLREAGHPPRDLRGDPQVPAGIERLQQSFEDSLNSLLLGGHLLPRTETQDLLRLLDASEPRIIFLHGPAGIGKSDVELELVQSLSERGIPFLPIRLDSQPPRGSLSSYSRDILDLPADPAQCLAVLAGGRSAVLLIDQLDAIRWTGGHSAEALRVVREILKAALEAKTIRIVLACRTCDLDNDFKRWEQEHSGLSQRIEVKPLGDEQVRSFVEKQGASYKDLSPSQRNLLQNPYTLFLWWELYKEQGQSPAFMNKTGLLSEYRRHLVRRLNGMGQSQAMGLLEEFVRYLDQNGRLDVPLALIGSRTEELAALQSLGVLREPRHGVLTFAHQRLLDFMIAERVAIEALAHGANPVNWLRENDQSLFRRDQLRQLLTLLRDQNISLYISMLEEIFAAKDIRFHLQHLALGILREPASISDGELNLVRRLLTMEGWRPHLFNQVILGSPAWFEKLGKAGLLVEWLASNDDSLIDKVLQACRAVAPQMSEQIERLLSPYWEAGDEAWRANIDSALGYDQDQFTERMTEWRLAIVQAGSRRLDWYELDNLAERHPTRAVIFLEAHLRNKLDNFERSGSLSLDWRDRTRGSLENACRSAPHEAWKRLLPLLMQSIRLFKETNPSTDNDLALALDFRHPRQHLKKITYHVRTLLSEAGGELARREELAFIDRIAPLFAVRSKSVQRLALYSFLKGPDELAAFALQWLYSDATRFQLGSFKDASTVEPARRLIERFALACPSEILEELEASLMKFYRRSERTAQYRHEHFQPRGALIRSGYGWSQHILLSAFPRDRMSTSAVDRAQAWKKKFGEPPKGKRALGEGGWVRSPIPPKKVRLLSDEDWLYIINNKNWGKRRTAVLKEVSHEQFARDFGVAARRDPERFVRLALRVPLSASGFYFSALFLALVEGAPTPEVGSSLSWRPAPVEEIERLFSHLGDSLKNRDIVWTVCHLVQARAAEPWSKRVTSLLCGFVESEPESVDSIPLEEGADIDVATSEDTRGMAAGALTALLFENKELVEEILPTIDELAGDSSLALRVAAQRLCLPLLNIDRGEAVRLFVKSCEHPDDRVLASTHTNEFLRYTWSQDANEMAPILARMIESANESASEVGAFWVTVGHIAKGLYGELAARCYAGSEVLRKGAAEAMGKLLQWPEVKDVALDGLLRLLDGSSEAVGNEVADLLREKEILESPEGPVLAEAYIRSSALEDDPGDLFYGLQSFAGSLVPYAPVLLAAVQRLAGDLAPSTRDFSTRLSGAVRFLPELLLRLYEQAEGPDLRPVRQICLDAWDSLLRGQVGLNWDVLRKLDA